ncbi:hypothetical protein HPB50_024433 [Hyalomma asiaticum]|uniref:Uncharacterized protein n=1 Tax=Hyalomma asiaticum TaxID=266040 RepID=A0ACB7T324_HYAAI|nr:hypothetical protein HPB50_024433 [Hyalomma asiaticum]
MYWFLGNTGAAISASTAPSHPMHSSTVHYAAHYSSDAATQAAPASYGNDGRLDIEQPTGDGLALPSCSTFSGNIFAVDPNISGAGTTLVNESFPGASGESSRELRGSMDSSAALVCDICKFAFKRAHHLEEHTSDHVAGKRHQCSSCGSLWRTPSALERHLLKHNNERPFKCSVCQASFKQKAHLTSHMKKKDH